MNSPRLFFVGFPQTGRALAVAILALACPLSWATTFTNNTAIGLGNTNYDSTSIIVSNCVLTVDGPHGFSSLWVAAGGVLTHSYAPSGTVSNLLYITDEAQVLDSTNPVTLLNSNVLDATVSVADASGTNEYTNGVDYLLTSTNGIWTQLQRTTSSTIPDGAMVLVGYESLLGTAPAGLNLSIAGDVQVDAGATIRADGIGYNLGPGAGGNAGSPLEGSGGGYGGIGGMSSSNALGGVTYGSFYTPTNLGSGGGASYLGAGGAGGGVIEITAGGSVVLNGSISADGGNGTNSRSGGGSGGSIWISGLTLSGAGTIAANGGSGEPTHGGGGGGGRIAWQFNSTTFTGLTTAYGGAGAISGGAGSVYTKLQGQNGLLVLDNGGQPGTNTTLAVSDNSLSVLIQGSAIVVPTSAWSLSILTVASNGLLLASSMTTLSVYSVAAITVEAGGAILADGMGFGPGIGSGAGHTSGYSPNWPCGGAGYGGSGAPGTLGSEAAGGLSYGTQSSPTAPGSGGGTYSPESFGGSGGGVIQLGSDGGILQVDGTISANGRNGSGWGGGGGSGGSISLEVGTLLGSGSISANGGAGAGSVGGGGGGGRIYLNPLANLFDGTISAYGGGGAGWGGAGTILIVPAQSVAQLILDNGGHDGTNTLVQSAPGTDLIVRDGAIASATGSPYFTDLYLNSNGWLAPAYFGTTSADSVSFNFTGNATIQPDAGVITDQAGYPAGKGNGTGSYYIIGPIGSNNVCSGAGHGGYGGSSWAGYVAGGLTYDSITDPIDPGSGGGTYDSSPGGAGGGVVRLSVTGTLELDGLVSANGGNGTGVGGGGGSGGSIWLSVGSFSGAGSITANGGNGAGVLGGGGGGGRVYVSCNNNLFSGTITAFGGAGANPGGTGPQLIQVSDKNAQVILDGGGFSGPPTPLSSSSSMDVTLRNGAVGGLGYNSGLSLGNILISSNAWLSLTNSAFLFPSISCSSLTIQAGGGITADGLGYLEGGGSGRGNWSETEPYYACSGAGHGGMGAGSVGNAAAGGVTYDTQISPSMLGSGGGFASPYSIGGGGGGGLALTVNSTLDLEGVISANGGNGGGIGGGGGSGGGIKITAGTLTGGGTIRANGGAGAGSAGGGGGGGCIAVYATMNSFGGTISAFGGGGANWGGAGTIYVGGQLILDNAGQLGSFTPIQSQSSATALILRNGAVAYQQAMGQTFASVLIGSNAWLSGVPSNLTSAGMVNLRLTGNATVQPGGGIVADSVAPAGGSGVGRSSVFPSDPCGGGGYGGMGANSSNNSAAGGIVYGSTIAPTLNGSSGGGEGLSSIGGPGGGSIQLSVNGTLQASGRISANGGNGSGLGGGGGSGGSIFLSVGSLAGDGVLTANGGNGVPGIGGGGGGGRISIGYSTDGFLGTITAHGGGGYANGGGGTIYTKANSQPVGQLLVDNGGLPGAETPLSSAVGLPSQPFSLTIQNGAVVCPQSNASIPPLNNLTIGCGSMLTGIAGPSTLQLLVFSNADILHGGVIAVDGLGYAQANGPGDGQSTNGYGSGAGYGGAGGASATAVGGANYGSATQPTDFGSGGGLGSGPAAGGSAGGGAIRLSVGGILTVDGELTAEGGPGLQDDSGGGSGGSVWVSAGLLAGSGLVAADGGAGALYCGGGGAGGRIALYSLASLFSGHASAAGASGYFSGANGTIVFSNYMPPVVQGTISDTNGQPVAGVLLMATSGVSPGTTDTNGNYALAFLPGMSFAVTPSQGALVFIPPALSYTNISTSVSNQDYLVVATLAPVLAATGNATNLTLSWQALPGVTYQIYSSTNLVNWQPYGAALSGSNVLQVLLPIAANPSMCFRLSASQ